MPNVEDLKRRLDSIRDLQSVAKTMKALAAVNIRQYEKAVAALGEYTRTVELGLQIVLRDRPGLGIAAKLAPLDRLGAVIFGSDQGMCGQLNEEIIHHAKSTLDEFGKPVQDQELIAVGMRVATRLEDETGKAADYFPVPSSVSGITSLVQKLVVAIDKWQAERNRNHIFLFYCKQISGASYQPHHVRLLPVDQKWLEELRTRDWPTNRLPIFTMSWEPLFSALIHHYLFVSLYRAAAESLASENASRLASMQGAERNIEEQLNELQQQYHRQRQMSITEELLDVVAGFEALTTK